MWKNTGAHLINIKIKKRAKLIKKVGSDDNVIVKIE